MVLLALDTATHAVTVAVLDGSDVLGSRTVFDERRHTETLAPAIRDALAEADIAPAALSEVLVGVGPGPFTGLRVGVVTARTMGFALGIPVHGVCSLDALAQQVVDQNGPQRFLVTGDARRREVYWAVYRRADGRAEREGDPQVSRAADLPDSVRALPTVGRGPLLYPEALSCDWADLRDVRAVDLAAAGQAARAAGLPLLPPEPMYLRRPDAQPRAARVPATNTPTR